MIYPISAGVKGPDACLDKFMKTAKRETYFAVKGAASGRA